MQRLTTADVLQDIHKNPIASTLAAIASGYRRRLPDDLDKLGHQCVVDDTRQAWRRRLAAKGGTWS